VLVVLVSRDGAAWLRECLRALSTQTYPRLGVIAVDNGSTDGSLDLLRRSLGEERVLSRPDNPGLPAAVQEALAIPAARGADFFLVLHDDAALDPEAIWRMVEVAHRIEGVGIVGPKVVDWDDPTILREVGLSTDRFGYPYSPLEHDEVDHGQYDRVREVLFVSSAAMLVSRAAFERAGPPDERFASSREDLDFCWRARIAGFRVVMTPLARARHRGATARGERPASTKRGRSRVRYEAERAGLAAILKNYGLLSLLWVLPLYAIQGLGKTVLWAVSRRFDDVWQTVEAWLWNIAHLPGTIRRRVRAQSVRTVPDRSVRRYMAPATARMRRWTEAATGVMFGQQARDRAAEDREGIEDLEFEEPAPLSRRALSFARAHPIVSALFLLVVVGVLADRFLVGSSPLTGGALAAPPSTPSAYFRELLSSARTTGLGGPQPASPALGFLGVISFVLGASTWLAVKALLILLPPAAGWTFYRTFVRETGHRGPAVVGAVCYALSATLLWAFSQGRIPVLVMLAVLPAFAGRIWLAFERRGVHPVRFIAATGIVLAAGIAFFPGMALAAGLLVVPWLVVPAPAATRARRWPMALGLLVAGVAAAAALLLPLTIDLVAGGGHGLASLVGRPSFSSLARLAPDGGTGSWAIAWFLPAAALLSYTLVQGSARPATRYLVIGVAAVFLAWASTVGALPRALTNPSAYLAVAALAYSALVVYGLASVIPRMGEFSFGYRQVAVVAVVALLGGGLTLQALLAARGDWAIGSDRLPAAWSLVGDSAPGGYRVLFLGRLSGEPMVPPGGDPANTVTVGGVSLRYGITDQTGATALDTGRVGRGPGYGVLERVVGDLTTGSTDHVGALLAPFGIRYIVSAPGDLPPAIEQGLAEQADIDRVPAMGLTIYRDPTAWHEATATKQPELVKPALAGPSAASGLPPNEGNVLHPVNGGFEGTASGAGAAFVADQFAGGWRVAGNERTSPDQVFGWAMRLPVGGAGTMRVLQPSQTPRDLEIAFIALAWLVALWITRRSSRT
jgi:GT2 family glycosyltransferase